MKKTIFILAYASYFTDGGQVYMENFVYGTKAEIEFQAKEQLTLTCIEDLHMTEEDAEKEVKTLLEEGEWSMENDDYTEAYGYKITEVNI